MEENDRIIKGLYSVLSQVGVILPLGRESFWGIDGHTSRVPSEMEGNPRDVLVMRLADRDENVSKERLQACLDEAPEGSQEVMLKWSFDSAGAPYGFVEGSCHSLGEVDMKSAGDMAPFSRVMHLAMDMMGQSFVRTDS